MSEFYVQDLANAAWAFATASQQDAQLFAVFARAAEWEQGDFNMQDLASTAWACAMASQLDTKLFAVLARGSRVARGRLQRISTRQHSIGTRDSERADALLVAIIAEAVTQCVGNFDTHELANTAWASG